MNGKMIKHYSCFHCLQKLLIELQVYISLQAMQEPVLKSSVGTCQSPFRQEPTQERPTEGEEKSPIREAWLLITLPSAYFQIILYQITLSLPKPWELPPRIRELQVVGIK